MQCIKHGISLGAANGDRLGQVTAKNRWPSEQVDYIQGVQEQKDIGLFWQDHWVHCMRLLFTDQIT